MTDTDDRFEHGTRYGYNHYGCRCTSCTRSNAEYIRDYRARARRRAEEVEGEA